MTALTVQQLDTFGPDRCDPVSLDQAQQMCLRLATGRYENFSVLSVVVPPQLRDDFAAIYAFCRWADDLGDEVGDPGRALHLLGWWRRELHECFEGNPRHPVFRALEPVIRKHELPIDPFDHLIQAFEQDQNVDRYETWDQLLDYCKLSADPVGRLVLMVCGEDRSERIFELSDQTCTALQLTNHWQDVRRDIIERNRIYIPKEMIDVPDLESRLISSAQQGFGVDHEFLQQYRKVMRHCIERTWPMFEKGNELLGMLRPQTRPIIWLFAAGGQYVLRLIEQWNYETALHRPKLSRLRKLQLVGRAWWGARRSRNAMAVKS